MLAYNALKELDDQVNNVLSAQQEAHGYLNTLQSLSDRQSALANKESSLAQLKQDNETLDAEIQALREQIAGMDPADENLPALSAALAEKEAAYNDNLLTIAQTEAEITVEKSTLEADMAAAGVTAETLPERLTAAAEAAAAADAAVDGIDALLASQGTDRRVSPLPWRRRRRSWTRWTRALPSWKARWKNWITVCSPSRKPSSC